ncbi:MAG: 23S rRNA (adenine(2030)-N(6))-methyltransferase RlmJ, partial [Treponema sp.]|nr:23S rRNA (adenine(2030)-N(6))-methyltransferase RlmJ [Treponema sp.]
RDFFLYFNFAKSCIKNDFYPGSPLIEKHFMRKCDNLILCELNKNECTLLKENVTGELQNVPSIHIHNIDGFLAFTSLTPPKIKRGLFFCDPSYEEKDEYKKVAHSFEKLFSKWNTCIFALWYPLLFHKDNECTLMKQKIIQKAKATSPNISVLDAALLINKKDSHKEMSLQELKQNKNNPPRLYGSGMLIVNSPWQMDEKLKAVLPTLKNILQVSENGSFGITLY